MSHCNQCYGKSGDIAGNVITNLVFCNQRLSGRTVGHLPSP